MKKNKSAYTSETAHYFASVALAAGVAALSIAPQFLGTSIAAVSDGFTLFKIKSLKFRIFALSGGAACGVMASIPNTAPNTSRGVLMELLDAVDHEAGSQTQWSEWVHVRRATYAGPLEWYHTRTGTYDTTEVVPCSMYFSGTGTNIVNLEIFASFQFKDPAPTAATPMALALRSQIKRSEEDEAVRLLREKTLRAVLGIPPGEPLPAAAMSLGVMTSGGVLLRP